MDVWKIIAAAGGTVLAATGFVVVFRSTYRRNRLVLLLAWTSIAVGLFAALTTTART